MVTLTAAVFTDRVVRSDSRIATIAKPMAHRQKLCVSHLPRVFAAWVVFAFEAPAGQTFPIATEVRSVTGRLLWFGSRPVTAPSSGLGECAVQVSFAVPAVGPYSVSLLLQTTVVWQQTVVFEMSELLQ